MAQKRQRQPGRAGDAALLKRPKAEISKTARTHQSMLLCVGAEPWQKADAAWFRARPKRCMRVRPMHPGELDSLPAGQSAHMLVRQIRPGFREKMFVSGVTADLPDDDAVLLALWQRLNDAPGQPVPLATAVADALSWAVIAGGVQ